MTEQEFLKKVLVPYLELHRCIVTPQNSRTPANRHTRYIPGVADIIICTKSGQYYEIEAKTDTGILTDSQIKRKAILQERYLVVRPSDFKEVLKDVI